MYINYVKCSYNVVFLLQNIIMQQYFKKLKNYYSGNKDNKNSNLNILITQIQ